MSETVPMRHLSAPLLLGILILPVVFVWFLLRRGYSNAVRAGGFLYFGLGVAVGLGRMLF